MAAPPSWIFYTHAPESIRRSFVRNRPRPWDMIIPFHLVPGEIAIHYWSGREEAVAICPHSLPRLVPIDESIDSLFVHPRSRFETAVLAKPDRHQFLGLTATSAAIWECLAAYTPVPDGGRRRTTSWPASHDQAVFEALEHFVSQGWATRLLPGFRADQVRGETAGKTCLLARHPASDAPLLLTRKQEYLWELLTRDLYREEHLAQALRKRFPRAAVALAAETLSQLDSRGLLTRFDYAYPDDAPFVPHPELSFRLWKNQGYLFHFTNGRLIRLNPASCWLWRKLGRSAATARELASWASRKIKKSAPELLASCRDFLARALHHELVRPAAPEVTAWEISDQVRLQTSLVHQATGATFVLNDTARIFWERLLQEPRTGALLSRLAGHYDVPPSRLTGDLRTFLDTLRQDGFIRPRRTRPPAPTHPLAVRLPLGSDFRTDPALEVMPPIERDDPEGGADFPRAPRRRGQGKKAP